EQAYRSAGQGNVPYHPRLMVKLLVYGYCTGVFSSRQIATQIHENIAFRVLAAGHQPSHRTIARFRRDHVERFQSVFLEVLQIAREAKLVTLGTVAIDGTKIKANASKHKAMSYGRMAEEEARLKAEIAAIVDAAEEKDSLEDEEFGPDFRGDELPAELARREKRLATIQAAKARL
ncbi:MAG: transposase, partial [Candidatus Competibacteraceae bacterium]|nr:transposase [Candidatus Competibacteraceae bacterium]